MKPSSEIQTKEALFCIGLSCGYPGKVVLQNIEFSLARGEILSLLGVNGSGKSTLLKTIAKSLPPLAGKVAVNGCSIADLGYRQTARLIAFVPQDEQPTFPFKVSECVLMGRLPHATHVWDSREDWDVAVQSMEEADCLDLADRSIHEISGGERQRVWIARALAQRAQVMLLDEPTAHLDLSHQLQVTELIGKLASKGYSFIAAVHDLNIAADISHRCAIIDEGTIRLIGKPDEVLQSDKLEQAFGVQLQTVKFTGDRFKVFATSRI